MSRRVKKKRQLRMVRENLQMIQPTVYKLFTQFHIKNKIRTQSKDGQKT